jgi:2-methylisocitrate lyase-like PEP mutase family enzyme
VPIPDQSPTLQELKKWGYRMVWVSVNTLYAGYLAQQRFLNEMLKTGRTLDPDTVMDHEEFLGLLSM